MTSDALLKKVTLFSRLSPKALQEVFAALKFRQLQQGEVLFSRGDPGDELIIVESGKIAIYIPQPNMPEVGKAIRLFSPGEMLGEMAIIDQKPRSASARAEEPTTIFTLSAEVFYQLLEKNPNMAISAMAGLSDRIRYTTDFINEVRAWVNKINVGEYQDATISTSQAKYDDPNLAVLAAEFAQMATQVKNREDSLKQEVAQLRIEIDDAKRKQEVKQIIDSEYYRELKEKMKAIREQNKTG
jgi:CRP-like cAMP-binding protein